MQAKSKIKYAHDRKNKYCTVSQPLSVSEYYGAEKAIAKGIPSPILTSCHQMDRLSRTSRTQELSSQGTDRETVLRSL